MEIKHIKANTDGRGTTDSNKKALNSRAKCRYTSFHLTHPPMFSCLSSAHLIYKIDILN